MGGAMDQEGFVAAMLDAHSNGRDFWGADVEGGVVLTLDGCDDKARWVCYGMGGLYGRMLEDADPWELSLYGDEHDVTDVEGLIADLRGIEGTWLVAPSPKELEEAYVLANADRFRGYLGMAEGISVDTPEGRLAATAVADDVGGFYDITVRLHDPDDESSSQVLSMTEVVAGEERGQFPTAAHTYSYDDTTDEPCRIDARVASDEARGVPVPTQEEAGEWLHARDVRIWLDGREGHGQVPSRRP